MNIIKTFFKFFLIGLLILSVFVGGWIIIYYAFNTHWILGLGSVVFYFAIIVGGMAVFIFELC